MKISAVIITYNEEKNLARCLSSIKELADEILVLDSFSKDKTQEIALEFGAKFEQHAFDGHIEQKNRAMHLAKYEYVLSLDADEALSDKLQKHIQNIKKSAPKDAYRFNRKTYYIDRWINHSGWYPDAKIRLWNRKKGQWGGTNPHDSVIMNQGSVIEKINADILHYSYYSIQEHFEQNAYFSNIAAEAMFEKGKKSSIFKALIKSNWIFIRNYFFRLGFLDGKYGYIICKMSARGTWAKYIKLLSLIKTKTS